MSYEIPGFTRSYDSTEDLSGSFLKFVKLSGALLTAVEAATDNAVGVLQNKPNDPGQGVFTGDHMSAGTVMISGVSRVMSGAAVDAGTPVSMDATGAVVAATAGGKVVGITEDAASAAGEPVSVLLAPLGGVAAPSA